MSSKIWIFFPSQIQRNKKNDFISKENESMLTRMYMIRVKGLAILYLV